MNCPQTAENNSKKGMNHNLNQQRIIIGAYQKKNLIDNIFAKDFKLLNYK
tara:strand:- start:2679 stop:2828 length:150 start_codon:yes stop_codon:yes gene_type:complete